jgi:hypothetical protein
MDSLSNRGIETVAELRSGQKVVTHDDQVLGELRGVVTRSDASYMHVLRYGPGMDEVFIPTIAVHRVVGDHVYVDLDALDLVGEPWHEGPSAAESAAAPTTKRDWR